MTRLQAFSHDTFRSLRTRNFRLFFVGQLISQTGTWLSMVTQTLLVLHLTSSGVALGLLTAFQFGPMLVLGAWAGAVADRADKRRLLITVQTLSMLQSFTLGALQSRRKRSRQIPGRPRFSQGCHGRPVGHGQWHHL